MAEESRDRKPAQVEADVRRLVARALSDADLRAEFEELARQRAFSGLTWLWGPELYRRNRVLFRPFILSHFGTISTYMSLGTWKWEVVEWKGPVAEVLERWLAEVDRNDDVELFRRLYQWKMQDASGRRERDDLRIRADLLRRFETAPTAAGRAGVLAKFNVWLELDEAAAIRLYTIDPAAAGPYLLQHLPSRWGWGGEKRELWQSLFNRAQQRGDQSFAMRLYRRQVPVSRWEDDALALCRATLEAAELCTQLNEHHPKGWGLELGAPIGRLVDARGRDVVPYMLKHLKDVWPRWYGRGGYGKLLDTAYANGWWDLWSRLLNVCAKPDDWNEAVRKLAVDRTLPEREVTRRLLLLTGVSREWNFAGFSMAQVQQLDDKTAVTLYERFPALVRGPFKLHLQTGFWSSLPKLICRVVENNDETLIDYLASRLINRQQFRWSSGNPLQDLEPLADYFEELRGRDPVEFARRAANVLTQVPAYTFWDYGKTIHDNRLARLLLERSLDSFLGDPSALRDLVEASEIHVQHLAYRVLGLDDDRARTAAVENLDILIGTLLRPLHRATRLAAFKALANAAATSVDCARRIVERGRDALALPDRKYPKEALVGLMGALLHRWSELRAPTEEPVIYRRKETVA
jgi:hypothetical protein